MYRLSFDTHKGIHGAGSIFCCSRLFNWLGHGAFKFTCQWNVSEVNGQREFQRPNIKEAQLWKLPLYFFPIPLSYRKSLREIVRSSWIEQTGDLRRKHQTTLTMDFLNKMWWYSSKQGCCTLCDWNVFARVVQGNGFLYVHSFALQTLLRWKDRQRRLW